MEKGSNKLLNIEELADYLGVSKSWLYERTRKKEIPYFKLGKYLRFDAQAVESWLEEQQRSKREKEYDKFDKFK